MGWARGSERGCGGKSVGACEVAAYDSHMKATDSAPSSLTTPRYSLAEAASLAGLVPQMARRWLLGYTFGSTSGLRHMSPVGRARTAASEVSFLDLVELVAIRGLKDFGLPLGAIRQLTANCRALLQVERPLVTLRFSISGRDVFIESGSELLEVGRHRGQLAWRRVIEPYLASLDFDDVFVRRWWPLGRTSQVVVDPDFGFGLPVVAGSGVRTEIILERFRAGDLAEQIASDFNLNEESVERALQFEVSRLAA